MVQSGVEDPMKYNYTVPMLLFASLGVLAFFFGIWLLALNAKHHYGLQDPNIKRNVASEMAEMESAEE